MWITPQPTLDTHTRTQTKRHMLSPFCVKNNLVNMQCTAENTEYHLNLSVKNMQWNGQPFKSWVFYGVCWALNFATQAFWNILSIATSKIDLWDTLSLLLHRYGCVPLSKLAMCWHLWLVFGRYTNWNLARVLTENVCDFPPSLQKMLE